MKVERLLMYLKDHLTNALLTTREKKIKVALESAKINAEETKAIAQQELENLAYDLTSTDDITSTLQQMSETFDKLETAEIELKRIEQIKNFLKEEIEQTK